MVCDRQENQSLGLETPVQMVSYEVVGLVWKYVLQDVDFSYDGKKQILFGNLASIYRQRGKSLPLLVRQVLVRRRLPT